MSALEEERAALRAVARLVERRRFDEAIGAIAALGDGESTLRRALTALIQANVYGRAFAAFESWRRKVAESDLHLNGFFGTELPALVDEAELALSFASNEGLVTVLQRVVARLETDEGRLVVPPTLREQAVGILFSLPSFGVDATLRSFDELQNRHPRSVQVRCYRGELLLWLGRYRQAWRNFGQASRIEPTRWAEIGKLAVLALTGHLARADGQSQLAEMAFTPVPGSTLPVYQGVLARRAGRLDAAIAHLEAAVEQKPTRLGARIELCLALRAAERGSRAVPHVAVVLKEATPLLVDAAESLSIDWRSDRPLLVGTEVLEQALRAMRGNRSSMLATWLDHEGTLRVLPRR
ncbi:MAG TPA: hypothetical protein VF765_11680 [Polyangiaceae bacterium]